METAVYTLFITSDDFAKSIASSLSQGKLRDSKQKNQGIMTWKQAYIIQIKIESKGNRPTDENVVVWPWYCSCKSNDAINAEVKFKPKFGFAVVLSISSKTQREFHLSVDDHQFASLSLLLHSVTSRSSSARDTWGTFDFVCNFFLTTEALKFCCEASRLLREHQESLY